MNARRDAGARAKATDMEHALTSALCAMNTGQGYAVLAPSATAVSTMTLTAQLNVSSVCPTQLLVAVGWMEGWIGCPSTRGRSQVYSLRLAASVCWEGL